MNNPTFRISWSGRPSAYTAEEIETVAQVMRSADSLTQGPHLAAFEKRFREYLGADHCFALTNC
ncbi:MAG TPA: DegT/DnrJ/EryC1/StrS family aminotransferase, partial [Verrucomicrobiae bacterium]|nr:DegT/DnrJ/EryC1/StrS family aminotransferase [Verrucomicrobiae bacterium]